MEIQGLLFLSSFVVSGRRPLTLDSVAMWIGLRRTECAVRIVLLCAITAQRYSPPTQTPQSACSWVCRVRREFSLKISSD